MSSAPELTLDHLNLMTPGDFAAALADIFEHGGWIAESAAAWRPYNTVNDLHAAMMAAMRNAPPERLMTFLRGHPDLGGKVARSGNLTVASRAEQGGLGLDRLSDQEFERFERLNAAYRERFAFPFIICVRRQTRDAILDAFERRSRNDKDVELSTALDEIGHLTRLRLVARVDGPGKPKTEGRLTTHVLDTARGRPAAGVAIALYEIGTSARGLIGEAVTNADGRTEAPLIAGGPLRIGCYELQFAIGDYFRATGAVGSDPPYLQTVPIRFSIAEPEGHYHVPLLASPWSYTTYRGS